MDMNAPHTDAWPTGFMLIQGNRLEALGDLMTTWMRSHPLRPLEDEVILVQSNGIGQWLKLALARDAGDEQGGCGIAAALQVTLPARFIWNTYCQVLGDLPDISAFHKAPLGWRLYRMLGDLDALAKAPGTADHLQPLQGFLQTDGDVRRRHQLAMRLADLFDQYQVYRSDWLQAWQAGEDVLIRPDGRRDTVPETQRWQPLLWRALLEDITQDDNDPGESRAAIHQRFLEASRSFSPSHRPHGLPRRVIVFGISSLPRQTLEVLEGIAPISQVMLFVHNPSCHYWGDIIEGRDLFRRGYRRLNARKVPEGVEPDQMHLHGHPLLAAWGKQGRDYIRLLDEHDQREQYEAHFQAQSLSIDLFESPGQGTLLQQIQDDILELRPLNERRELATGIDPDEDRSLEFLVAHGPQREVEILHDQLLDAFQQAHDQGHPLPPRDILVMVPDVETYAPHIEAVFGRIGPEDPRHIPFHIADQGQRHRNPVLIGLERLLNLPQARFSVSEILDLLDIPALRARFAIEEADLPRLRQWIQGANIRWGLDARQRNHLGLPPDLEQNTWQFGLRRMLLGFASNDAGPWRDVEPYDEVGGLEAGMIGPLDQLLQTLGEAWRTLQTSRTPQAWMGVILQLMDDCFAIDSDADHRAITRVGQALEQWVTDCQAAGADQEPLPLDVVRDTLLNAVDEPTLNQHFLGGAVNFATLMPMRAVPFRQIWLLGMNDGDYPRSHRPADFDLMARDYRPGDRSRREDDRYLFLEALLSARERLVISWVGRSIRDNSERPPSVLVGQLRDHIAAGWRLGPPREDAPQGGEGTELVRALTTEHPLQPFSARYFDPQRPPRVFTHAHEWQSLNTAPMPAVRQRPRLPPPTLDAPIDLGALGHFLRYPARHFYSQRLGLYLQEAERPAEDEETFHLDGLGNWSLRSAMIEHLTRTTPDGHVPSQGTMDLSASAQRLTRAGELPLPPFDTHWREELLTHLEPPVAQYQSLLADHPDTCPAQGIRVEAQGITLEDTLTGLRQDATGARLRVVLQASRLVKKDDDYQWHHLIRHWPTHLAAQLQAPTTTCLLGPQSRVILQPMDAGAAQAVLIQLMEGYREGLQSPLPLPCRTGFAALIESEGERANPDSRTLYEGGHHLSSERDEHEVFARFWPDHARLTEDPDFARAIETLYHPLYRHLIAPKGVQP
ncbi:exodeoxyribonuclease V subunit gamma [Ectothiorhodospira haloalkaliphila]|uniref:exodeoxyribonuclease V subunit gamma n=1 Tax=Ectothiorhodospira haloalkaliphila TaxID=421628 RepID=UPI001EE944AD|nr:exodeoxyribonuclease V subunit gamma [Ectothiorhodospira haloalkaliphila]MCG5525314.1 exodeoxyribonuclease V subunit gamma [Ectothiorhodospira haloalkaliphila]